MKIYVHKKDPVEMLDQLDLEPEEIQSSASFGNAEDEDWMLIERKDIRDFDGFWTKYSLYREMPDGDRFVTVFGDPDIYSPHNGDFDAEFDSEAEAYEFFEDFEGFTDEDDY